VPNSSVPCHRRAHLATALLAAGFAGATLLSPQIAAAQSGSPFAKYVGSWRGSGEVIEGEGAHERITCRANFVLSSGGKAVTQTLVCASDSFRLEISCYLEAEGQKVRGDCQEATRKVEGHLVGRVFEEGQFSGSISGLDFTAETSAMIAGRKLTVSLRTQGGGGAKAEIVLSREN
jgi:hypothetical protein